MENSQNALIIESNEDFDIVEFEVEKEVEVYEKLYEYEQILDAKYNATALVAEDNDINQKLIKYILIRYGIKPYIVSNGKIALELRKKYNFDIILMDLAMPVLDGVAARAHIVKFETENHLNHIPIIAVTAIALSGDRQRFLNIGFDEYCAKPIKKDELAKILNIFLPHKREGATPTMHLVREKIQQKIMKKKDEILPDLQDVEVAEEIVQEQTKNQKDILICKQNQTQNKIYSMVLAAVARENDMAESFEMMVELLDKNSYKLIIIDDKLQGFTLDKFAQIQKNFKAILFSDTQDVRAKICFDLVHKHSINKAELVLMTRAALK